MVGMDESLQNRVENLRGSSPLGCSHVVTDEFNLSSEMVSISCSGFELLVVV